MQEAGQADQVIPDEVVLAQAHREQRILLTLNRKDFIRLHRQQHAHHGIIACTFDLDFAGQAARIHGALLPEMAGRLMRVSRPA